VTLNTVFVLDFGSQVHKSYEVIRYFIPDKVKLCIKWKKEEKTKKIKNGGYN
jgi:hypothetical protein